MTVGDGKNADGDGQVTEKCGQVIWDTRNGRQQDADGEGWVMENGSWLISYGGGSQTTKSHPDGK